MHLEKSNNFFQNLRNYLNANKAVLLLYGLILMLCLGLLLANDKNSIHLYINQYHSPFFDGFFKYATYLGDGLLIIILCLPLAFISLRVFFIHLSAFLFSGLIAQLGKRVIFDGLPRPAAVFTENADLHFVEGVKLAMTNSFPSGHTTSAFAFFFSLVILTKNTQVKIALLLISCLVGFSRMYLSLHFLPDVLAGSFIGIISASLMVASWNSSNKRWLNHSILKPNKYHENKLF